MASIMIQQLKQLLGDAFNVKSDADEIMVTNSNGILVGWVNPENLLVSTFLNAFFAEDSELTDDNADARLEKAEIILREEFEPQWGAHGFHLDCFEYATASGNSDTVRGMIVKKCELLDDIVDTSRWMNGKLTRTWVEA